MKILCDSVLNGEKECKRMVVFSGFQKGNDDGKNIPRTIHLSCMTALHAAILSVLMHSGNLCSGIAS